MSYKIISKTECAGWIERLQKTRTVIAPVADNLSPAVFKELAEGDEPIIDGSRMMMSPRDYFLPGYEILFEETTDADGNVELVDFTPQPTPRVTIGMWLADARGLQILDLVFLDEKFYDPYYASRRKDNIIVAVLPAKKRWSSFWSSTDDIHGWKDAADVVLYDLADCFAAESRSESGAGIISEFPDAPADKKEAADKLFEMFADNGGMFFQNKIVSEKLVWDSPVWEEISRRCISCGICSYTCPSCSCFDMADEVHGRKNIRYRCHDSCQFAEFTLMGQGHNPRPTQMPRCRQRLLHKFKYQPEKFGTTGCVGCGRCVELCPVNIDIRDAMNKLTADLAAGSQGNKDE